MDRGLEEARWRSATLLQQRQDAAHYCRAPRQLASGVGSVESCRRPEGGGAGHEGPPESSPATRFCGDGEVVRTAEKIRERRTTEGLSRCGTSPGRRWRRRGGRRSNSGAGIRVGAWTAELKMAIMSTPWSLSGRVLQQGGRGSRGGHAGDLGVANGGRKRRNDSEV